MRPSASIRLAFLACVTLSVAGCGGHSGVQVNQGSGSLPKEPESEEEKAQNDASIVHVDQGDKIVTVRLNDQKHFRDAEVLITRNSVGQRSAVLRPMPRRSSKRLLETKILQGTPGIHHTVEKAEASVVQKMNDKHPSGP